MARSKKPIDPLRQLGLEPYDWAGVIETCEGLPAVAMLWRPLRVGEVSREGDYLLTDGVWRPADAGRVIASGDTCRRPMGLDAQCWYVGEHKGGDKGAGTYWWPFASLAEADARLPSDAVGVIMSAVDYRLLGARDPASWDWARYLATEAARTGAQVVEEDELTKLALSKAEPVAGAENSV